MWQCEYQSPVHDTSVKLQTIMELKQLNEGVTKFVTPSFFHLHLMQMEKGFLFSLFEIPESHLQSLPVKCPATVNVCLIAECGVGGGLLTRE